MGNKQQKSPYFRQGILHSKTDQTNAKQEYDIKFNMWKAPKKTGIGRQVLIYYYLNILDFKY